MSYTFGMKMVFIYGPPAVGKLTVAKELSSLTGFEIFHNHLVADLASAIFPYGTKQYSDLATNLRLTAWTAAMKSPAPGVILTFLYGLETYRGQQDDELVRNLAKKAKRARVKLYFVKLETSKGNLIRRVTGASRNKFAKLKDPKILRRIMRDFKLVKPVPFVESLVIDNSDISARSAAKDILAYINRRKP